MVKRKSRLSASDAESTIVTIMAHEIALDFDEEIHVTGHRWNMIRSERKWSFWLKTQLSCEKPYLGLVQVKKKPGDRRSPRFRIVGCWNGSIRRKGMKEYTLKDAKAVLVAIYRDTHVMCRHCIFWDAKRKDDLLTPFDGKCRNPLLVSQRGVEKTHAYTICSNPMCFVNHRHASHVGI